MVKDQVKTLKTENKLQNTLLEYNSPPKKSRQQIYQENYQKNKEKKKAQQKERYNRKKKQIGKQVQQQLNKYYGAEAIRVLMSLKEYTELNQEKRKIWLDFIWAFKDLNKIEINNIIEVIRIRELADNLINDYWTTAKNETRKGKSWNILSGEQKQRLIKYWGQEKVRKETNLNEVLKRQERDGKAHEKEIELAKFHEERGKVKCPCYSCEERKEIQRGIREKWNRELESYEREKGSDKEQCPECQRWVGELDEDSSVCKKCLRKYE